MALRMKLGPFVRAVVVGTLAAGAVVSMVLAAMFVPFVGSWNDAADVAGIIGVVTAITFGLVVLGAVFIGLPVTFVLQRVNRESEGSYIAAGTVFGFLVPLALLLALGSEAQGYWVCLLGAVAGGAAALVWWRCYRREQQAERVT
jgi:hypothetical protein